MAPITFGILIISDSRSEGSHRDETGPELKNLVTSTDTDTGKLLKGEVVKFTVVPDEEMLIMERLIEWSDIDNINIILTSGGTGFASRDVTPEATKKVIEKEAPGIATAMLISSMEITPMAMLSRAICGIRGKTLIINLPGSLKAVKECFNSIASVIPHAVDLILDKKKEVTKAHNSLQKAEKFHSSSHSSSSSKLNLDNVAKRPRESPYPMISVKAAIDLIDAIAEVQEPEVISIWDAQGRVLAEEIYSLYDLPPFRASIKDGYAVLAKDGKGRRRVLCGIKAGTAAVSLLLNIHIESGTCVRVNTGAPIPNDATAVVQVEDTKLLLKNFDGTEEKEIEITSEPKEGQDIRPIGCDLQKGSLVLTAHTKIGAAEMGLLAACGHKHVKVFKLPNIGVLSTGDELQEPGIPLFSGSIYDSNKITLMSMFKENGYDPKNMGIVGDDEALMIHTIGSILEDVDVLVTSGSVSMGDRDMLKPILQQYFNAKIHFGRVNMKPGKPTTFATCLFNGRKKYLLCLPGNPVSAMVTSHLFVLPLLNRLHGDFSRPVIVKTELTSSYKLDPRPEYARAILKWSNEKDLPKAYSTGDQISSKLLSCKSANALLMLPGQTSEQTTLNPGNVIQAMLLGFK